jgi:hypothetical protein
MSFVTLGWLRLERCCGGLLLLTMMTMMMAMMMTIRAALSHAVFAP